MPDTDALLTLLASAGVVVAVIGLMLRYLQGSRARFEWAARAQEQSARLEIMVDRALHSTEQFGERLHRVEIQQQDQGVGPPVSEDERRELENRLLERINRVAQADFVEEVRTSLRNQQEHLETANLTKEFQERHKRTVERLLGELADLSQRGNLNLAIGIGIAAVGIGTLAYFVFVSMASLDPDSTGFTAKFIVPRISLVIFVQVFAYYFLRLYSSSLMEIKYFQNEITNVEVPVRSLASGNGNK